jgi:putative endonuclease
MSRQQPGFFMPFYTYILYSVQKQKYYIGYTAGPLADRLRRHNSGHKGFTGGIGDWVLVYSETFVEKQAAMQRERELKSWKSSKRIAALVGGSGQV